MEFQIKTVTYFHYCRKLHLNVEVDAKWVASKLKKDIIQNHYIDIPTMRMQMKSAYGVSVKRHVLYMVRKCALLSNGMEFEDNYDKLFK